MAPLKVHGSPASTCTVRVLATLEEKGVDYELVPVDLATGEHKQPAHLAKNPFGQVPALVDGDLTLFESRAITRYVCRKFKGSGTDLVRDSSLEESAKVDVWIEVEAQNFNPPISAIVFQCIFAPLYGLPSDEKVIAANVEKLGKVLDVYEAQLSKTKYLAGDFFSLADVHHLSYTKYLMATPHGSLIKSRPHVKAWWEALSSRPTCKKVTAGFPPAV